MDLSLRMNINKTMGWESEIIYIIVKYIIKVSLWGNNIHIPPISINSRQVQSASKVKTGELTPH